MSGIGAAIGGALAQTGNAVGGTLYTAKQQKKAATKAYKRSKKMYKNRYKWQMADMRRSGLNPILAYQTGAPGTPGATPNQVPDFGNIAEAGRAGAATGEAISKSATERDAIRAGIEKVKQDTATSGATQKNIETETLIKQTQVPKAKAVQSFDENIFSPLLKGLEGKVNSSKSLDYLKRYQQPKRSAKDNLKRINERKRREGQWDRAHKRGKKK